MCFNEKSNTKLLPNNKTKNYMEQTHKANNSKRNLIGNQEKNNVKNNINK